MAYDYVDPYQQARQQFSQMPSASQPFQQPVVPYSPDFTLPMPAVGGPLAGLHSQVNSVLASSGYYGRRQESMAEAAAKGAAIGFASALVWQQMKKRKAANGEYTTPFFRFLAIWWGCMLAGFGLSMVWPIESMKFLGTSFVLGTIASVVYLVYRVTGHGRYNTRRRGAHRLR
jgi:hypothetical protein